MLLRRCSLSSTFTWLKARGTRKIIKHTKYTYLDITLQNITKHYKTLQNIHFLIDALNNIIIKINAKQNILLFWSLSSPSSSISNFYFDLKQINKRKQSIILISIFRFHSVRSRPVPRNRIEFSILNCHGQEKSLCRPAGGVSSSLLCPHSQACSPHQSLKSFAFLSWY